VVLLPRFTAPTYIDAIARHRCTWLTSVPTMMALVVQDPERLARTDVSSVQRVMMGSAPLTQSLIDRVKAAFPRAHVSNGWGTTETGPVAFGPHPRGLPVPDLSIGYPQAGVDIRLVAGDDRDADEGVLELRTPAMMPGYLNLPAKTAEVITADGYYVTGDVMRRDAQGFYYFVGRADDMFVCGGENIYPGEVETMLERHPGIRQACVVPVPDEVRGAKPVAFVVCAAGEAPSAQAVKDWALANAPAYQHPRHVEFVAELPLAGTAKIDRKALVARAVALFGEVRA
jgi:acyl-CoA synthetase (AMP-forming)/AMP-acid ligase II